MNTTKTSLQEMTISVLFFLVLLIFFSFVGVGLTAGINWALDAYDHNRFASYTPSPPVDCEHFPARDDPSKYDSGHFAFGVCSINITQ